LWLSIFRTLISCILIIPIKKEKFLSQLLGYFSGNNWYKFDDLKNDFVVLNFSSKLLCSSPCLVKAWFFEGFVVSNQGENHDHIYHISFIFQSLFLTGQENDSTKNETKIETESQSSYMDTEGTESRICCYQKMQRSCEPWLLYIECVWVAACVLGNDYWRIASVLLCVPLETWRDKKELNFLCCRHCVFSVIPT
jgi:hypothetical protein